MGKHKCKRNQIKWSGDPYYEDNRVIFKGNLTKGKDMKNEIGIRWPK